jgi:(4-(4-[2-(gamma-L-glutamylamino)ethyl]phenoxymethyl)furan-2-yl)methanamine synthase
MSPAPAVLGWDIGGVNLKVARLNSGAPDRILRSICQPFEVQHALDQLPVTMRALAGRLGAAPTDHHAVTMTAELSQAFRSKREGVAFVLDALKAGFPSSSLHVYTVDGNFVSPPEARDLPLRVAASNWAATAGWVARRFPTAILIDIGTTTTDVIPIVEGEVVALGRTDSQRLVSKELVYSGVLRTPVEAVVQDVPLWGQRAGVSAEGFALIGDVYLWLGRLHPEDYTCPTPDGRLATPAYAGERLARVVCGDREMLNDDDITAIATAIADAQVRTIGQALRQVQRRWPTISLAVTTGLGEFIGRIAALTAGLQVVSLETELGVGSQAAPAAAVACLLDAWLQPESVA